MSATAPAATTAMIIIISGLTPPLPHPHKLPTQILIIRIIFNLLQIFITYHNHTLPSLTLSHLWTLTPPRMSRTIYHTPTHIDCHPYSVTIFMIVFVIQAPLLFSLFFSPPYEPCPSSSSQKFGVITLPSPYHHHMQVSQQEEQQ